MISMISQLIITDIKDSDALHGTREKINE